MLPAAHRASRNARTNDHPRDERESLSIHLRSCLVGYSHRVTSTYRDDRAVVEERLAQLEASHVERQLNGLRRLRSSVEGEPPPTPQPPQRRAPIWIMVGSMVVQGIDALRTHNHEYPKALLVVGGCCAVGVSLALLGTTKPYLTWRHRRKQQKALAKIDAEIAALEHAPPLRVEPSALEAARVRIAELEAEEAAPMETPSVHTGRMAPR